MKSLINWKIIWRPKVRLNKWKLSKLKTYFELRNELRIRGDQQVVAQWRMTAELVVDIRLLLN